MCSIHGDYPANVQYPWKLPSKCVVPTKTANHQFLVDQPNTSRFHRDQLMQFPMEISPAKCAEYIYTYLEINLANVIISSVLHYIYTNKSAVCTYVCTHVCMNVYDSLRLLLKFSLHYNTHMPESTVFRHCTNKQRNKHQLYIIYHAPLHSSVASAISQIKFSYVRTYVRMYCMYIQQVQ